VRLERKSVWTQQCHKYHKETELCNKKPFRFAGCGISSENAEVSTKGKLDVDDESEYAAAMDDEQPDNELDADFDDG
jgi:hypothetical protein